MAELVLIRKKQWADKLRAYRILLDGKEIGKIDEAQELRFPVSNGDHELQIKVDWCGSSKQKFSVDGRDVLYKVSNSLSGWKLLLALPTVIFNRLGYLNLERM